MSRKRGTERRKREGERLGGGGYTWGGRVNVGEEGERGGRGRTWGGECERGGEGESNECEGVSKGKRKEDYSACLGDTVPVARGTGIG